MLLDFVYFCADDNIYRMTKRAAELARKYGYATPRRLKHLIQSTLLLVPHDMQEGGRASLRLDAFLALGIEGCRMYRVPYLFSTHDKSPQCKVTCWNCSSVQMVRADLVRLNDLQELERDSIQARQWRQTRVIGMFWAIATPTTRPMIEILISERPKVEGDFEAALLRGDYGPPEQLSKYLEHLNSTGLFMVSLASDLAHVGSYDWIGELYATVREQPSITTNKVET